MNRCDTCMFCEWDFDLDQMRNAPERCNMGHNDLIASNSDCPSYVSINVTALNHYQGTNTNYMGIQYYGNQNAQYNQYYNQQYQNMMMQKNVMNKSRRNK